jgi:integrase
MTNPHIAYRHRGVLTNQEIDAMLKTANSLDSEYFRLRAKCLLAILKKFGKRRSEIARLKVADVKQVGEDLEFLFSLSKKRKLGLHQFLKYCKKNNDLQTLALPLPQIQVKWCEWQQSEKGHIIKNSQAPHSISLNDKYATYILQYLAYLKNHYPESNYLFPSGMTVFGETYIIFPDAPLSGSQLLRIVKSLNRTAWLHLFRETAGAQIAKEKGRTLDAVYEVKDCLDLESESTAYHYVRRYASKKHTVET